MERGSIGRLRGGNLSLRKERKSQVGKRGGHPFPGGHLSLSQKALLLLRPRGKGGTRLTERGVDKEPHRGGRGLRRPKSSLRSAKASLEGGSRALFRARHEL